MKADDTILHAEEHFADHLVAYDEALANGRAHVPLSEASLPPELRARLRRARDCLKRLKQDRPASKPVQSSSVGAVRLGRFELRRELGRGGFGIVYLAWDSGLRREAALKIPLLEAVLTPPLSRRFLHEAHAAAQLNHPGIVPIYETGEIGGVCYIVTAYCSGGSLAQWLSARTASVPPRQAAALIASLADAVQYMHEHHIWHRDIKPSNILLQSLERPEAVDLPFTPQLTDFGLAKRMKAEPESTQSGGVAGTPDYMAPEQADGRLQDIGPHTDIYALGAVLYELLTGQPPCRGAACSDRFQQVSTDEAKPRRRPRSDVPSDLETICLKCLEEAPGSRYASAGELGTDLRRFLSGEAILARPPSLWERARKWCLHPERVRSAGMFLLFFGLVFVLWSLVSLAGVALGLVQPLRPAATVRYLVAHLALFHVPMMGAGWAMLRRCRLALWMGALTALGFFFRMFVLQLMWVNWLGYPPLFDRGGLFRNLTEQFGADLLFTASAAILCLSYLLAVAASSKSEPRP